MVKSKMLNFNYLEKNCCAKYLEYNYHISKRINKDNSDIGTIPISPDSYCNGILKYLSSRSLSRGAVDPGLYDK